jgi:hypothetical protein
MGPLQVAPRHYGQLGLRFEVDGSAVLCAVSASLNERKEVERTDIPQSR